MKHSYFAFLVVMVLASPVSAHTGHLENEVSQVTTTSPSAETTATTSPDFETSTEVTTRPTPTVTTALVFTKSDLSGFSRSITLTKFRRFFTRNPIKRGELTTQIANALFLKAQEQEAAGQTAQAAVTLSKFEIEADRLQTIADTISANTTNPEVQAFLSTLATDKAVQLAELQLTPSGTSASSQALASKMVSLQSKTLRDIVRILEKDMPEDERQAKLEKIMAKYTEKEAKIDARVERKLALTKELKDTTSDDELEQEIEDQEDETLDEAKELETDELNTLAAKLGSDPHAHSLAVLEKLLLRVPEAAKAGIENAIQAILNVQIKDLEQNPDGIDNFLDKASVNSEIRAKVLERIKGKASESLKQEIESEKKKEETRLETQKKTLDKAKAKAKKESERKLERGNNTQAPEPRTQSTSTPKSVESGASQEQTEIEVKVKDGKFDKTSYAVKNGASVTVRFKNEDSTARVLTLSNGKASSSISAGETKLLAFTISGTVTFIATGVSGSGSITIQ